MDIDKVKSYATEANLKKAIAAKFPEDTKYLVVCNRQGRFVGIFPYGWNPEIPVGAIIHSGFPVVG